MDAGQINSACSARDATWLYDSRLTNSASSTFIRITADSIDELRRDLPREADWYVYGVVSTGDPVVRSMGARSRELFIGAQFLVLPTHELWIDLVMVGNVGLLRSPQGFWVLDLAEPTIAQHIELVPTSGTGEDHAALVREAGVMVAVFGERVFGIGLCPDDNQIQYFEIGDVAAGPVQTVPLGFNAW